MLAWRSLDATTGPWIILARGADAAQHLAARFLDELARRGQANGIRVAAESSGGFHWRDTGSPVTGGWLDAATATPLARHEPAETAELLARYPEILASMSLVEEHHPALLHYHTTQNDPLAVARVSLRALCLFNHFGHYHESGSFADAILPHFDVLVGSDETARWNYLGNIFQGLVMIGREEEAQHVIERLAVPVLTRSELRARMHYLLAMVHLRYAKHHDLQRAEHHLDAARAAIVTATTIAAADHAFLTVFIDNGMAFLRVRQKRTGEAIRLCQNGFATLTRALGSEAHRLHRSVLQYNTAQVYAAIGDLPAALDHYDHAIAMDPHYSEYYNESANLLLGQGRYEEALRRYDLAARVRAPYPELFHNVGVCNARLCNWPAARAAFDRSLHLDPAQPAVLLMRAEASDALGDSEATLADLDGALALDPALVAARVNLAVARFERREYALALAHMDEVILLDPASPEHYANRAEVHRAMGRSDLVRWTSIRLKRCGWLHDL